MPSSNGGDSGGDSDGERDRERARAKLSSGVVILRTLNEWGLYVDPKHMYINTPEMYDNRHV